LKARAAAAFDGDAQGLSLIACTDFGEAGEGAGCHLGRQLHRDAPDWFTFAVECNIWGLTSGDKD
jgi:hypothetical protein